MVNDAMVRMCKELTRILLPIEAKAKSFIRDSYHLKEMLSEVVLEEGDRLVSFDIDCMYPSIPREAALEVVYRKLQKDRTLKDRTDWKPRQIRTLLEVCLETHFKDIEGNIWTQVNGTPIGKSISGPIAGIYMADYEERHIYNGRLPLKWRPKFWKRQKDDVLAVWPSGKEEFINFRKEYLNQKEKRIQWSGEYEENGSLAVLDMVCTRVEGRIITRVHRKGTHTLKFASSRTNRPRREALGSLKGLVNRAIRLSDKEEDLAKEVELLSDAFILEGFSVEEVDRTVSEYLAKKMKNEVEDQSQEEEENVAQPEEDRYVVTSLYVPGVSEKLRWQLKKLGVDLVFKRGQTLGSMICNVKEKRTAERQKGVIYKIPCQHCQECYIGETCRHWGTRKAEHQGYVRRGEADKSGVANHAINMLHKPDWQNSCVVAKESRTYKRRMMESILIQARTGGDDDMPGIMNEDNNYRLDSTWGRTFKFIRKEYGISM